MAKHCMTCSCLDEDSECGCKKVWLGPFLDLEHEPSCPKHRPKCTCPRPPKGGYGYPDPDCPTHGCTCGLVNTINYPNMTTPQKDIDRCPRHGNHPKPDKGDAWEQESAEGYLDRHWPKGKNKDRGKAMVLHALAKTEGLKEKDPSLKGKKPSQKDPLHAYNKLRVAHQEVKDLIYADHFDDQSEELKNAIEGVHAVLYMAENTASTAIDLQDRTA